jgi:hypothetical protein
MTYILDNHKNATIKLATVAAAGPFAAAAASVDIASSFVITQTTNVALTIPNPTDATAGDLLRIGSDTTSTSPFSVNGITLTPGEFATFFWSGTAWLYLDGGRNAGAVVPVAAVAAGNFVVTHNLAMPAGSFSSVIWRAYNPAGNEVILKRNTAADTANATGFSSPVALAAPNLPLTFYFTPLA